MERRYEEDFPRMSVKHRRELVGFQNSDTEFDVDENGVIGGGTHLKPKQVHELIEKFGDDVVFLTVATNTRRKLVSLRMPLFLTRTPHAILLPSLRAINTMTLKIKK